MKRAIVFGVCTLAAALAGPSASAAERIDTVPLHHFYQPKSDFHFYTVSDSDVATVKADTNWRYLGTVGHVFPRRTPQTEPLMRLRKDEFGGVNHFYTVAIEEANNAITNLGWTEEGLAGHIATSQLPGTVPLYRLYKPCLPGLLGSPGHCDVHVYTTVESERDSGLANGYQLVRVEGYIWPRPSFYPPPPRIKPAVAHDTAQIPLALDLKDRRARGQTVDYDLTISNAERIPADWFAPLTVLPAERCWNAGKPSNARLFLEIAWGPGAKADRRGDCRPIDSRGDLEAIRYSLDRKQGVANNVQLTLRDRLTNIRHTTNLFPVGADGVDSVLVPAGCFHFLGRPGDYSCRNATALAACENLKQQGKPIVCRSGQKK